MEDQTLLCVHPHPDDESIACGGTLARAAHRGVRTVVVTCTGGEEGDNLAGIDLEGRPLAEHRRDELAAAVAILKVARHYWLGFRDSGMVGSDANDHPASFHRADTDDAARRLAAIIRAERPQVVVSDDEHGSYGHPDHIKANAVTARAVELAADAHASVEGPVWQVAKRYVHALGRSRIDRFNELLAQASLPSPFEADAGDGDNGATRFGVDDDEITTEVDVGAWWPAKRAAMAAHRSQIGADSFFLNLPATLAASVFATEQFALRQGSLGMREGLETDLFDGLAGGQ